MEKMIVYLGSDHVIQQPCFGLRENTLRLATSREAAIRQACRRQAAGILNAYVLDLDRLSVKSPNQEVLSGFDAFDVLLPDETDSHVCLCSETAVQSLEFASASFVSLQ